MSRACSVKLQVCLVHYRLVDAPMVEKLQLAIEQAIIAVGSRKAVSSSDLQPACDSTKARQMPSHNARM